MSSQGAWATHYEIMAVASLFAVFVHFPHAFPRVLSHLQRRRVVVWSPDLAQKFSFYGAAGRPYVYLMNRNGSTHYDWLRPTG